MILAPIRVLSSIVWITALFVGVIVPARSFLLIPPAIHPGGSQFPSIIMSMADTSSPHPFCSLPGDPSLILTTNVSLGDKKLEIMKAISKAITQHTGKPETYVAVSINDAADVIFGGSDEPAALGCVYSIGAIAMESNGAITSSITEQLEPFGVDAARIYINFFDMPRANVGWSKRTFAG